MQWAEMQPAELELDRHRRTARPALDALSDLISIEGPSALLKYKIDQF